jgi:uncharacterized membrane protein
MIMAQDLPPIDDTTPGLSPATPPGPPPGTPAPAARKATGLKIALALSVVLNVALIAGLAGGAMRAQSMRAMPDWGAREFYSLWHALPDDMRRGLREDARRGMERPDRETRRAQWAARVEAGQAHRQDLARMLRAEDFDAAQFVATLNAPRQARAVAISRGEAELVRRLEAMTPAERAAIAARIESQRGPRR